MRFPRIVTTVVLGLTVSIVAIGCGQQSAPVASTSPAASRSAEPSSASSGSASPAARQSPPASASATTSPAPLTATKPSASASGGVSAADLVSKAKNTAEYSFTYKMTGPQTTTGKMAIKGAKARMEMTVNGQSAVILADTSNKTSSMLMPSEKMALKMDFGQASAQTERPADRIGALSSDAKPIGTETIDGKTAAVFDLNDAQEKGKFWIWIERGLPLKAEIAGPQGPMVIEYTDYQFGPLPDTLFEVPADYKTMDLPAGIPGVPGAPGGVPGGAPGVPGVPGNIPVPGR